MVLAGAQVDGRQVKRLTMALTAAGSRPPLRRLRVVGEANVIKNFRDGGYPQKWRPLDPVTVERRRQGKVKRQRGRLADARGRTIKRASMVARPLIDTGRLRASVQSENVGRDNFKVYSGVEYAAAHNFGYKHIPARPFMVWRAETLPIMTQIMLDHLTNAARKRR